MDVLQRELERGSKRLGIFYGAAHMPDFERRLVLDFGLKKAGVEWRTAWNLRSSSGSPLGKLLGLTRELTGADLARILGILRRRRG